MYHILNENAFDIKVGKFWIRIYVTTELTDIRFLTGISHLYIRVYFVCPDGCIDGHQAENEK
jgi:hypothetical protein